MDRIPYTKDMSEAAPSTMAASTTWPRPPERASSRAHTRPKAKYMPPPPKSPTRLRGGTGVWPLRPMAPITPARDM